MVRFRSHRGGLEESLKTTVELNTLKELVDHLNEALFGMARMDNITFKRLEPLSDLQIERGHWQRYMVLMDGRPVGVSDGELT